jgi:signal transduction histidine kinase
MGSDRHSAERLPSLPQVLVRILDTIHNERTGLAEIAEIVRRDAAMATRLIGVANSSYYVRNSCAGRSANCQSVERALLVLGTDTVKTVVMTDAIRQFFSQFKSRQQPFLKAFWRRSLIGANFAHVLANLTSYRAPDEAYLCGLLTDVGQMVLLNRHGQHYLDLCRQAADDRALLAAERELCGESHADIGAALAEQWAGAGFMADALRYHHEPGAQILDASHLVKIINLASMLSAPGELGDEALRQAHQLFGLNEALTRELRSRIGADVEKLAASLNIDIGLHDDTRDHPDIEQARSALGQRLGELGQLSQASRELWLAQSLAALETAVQRTLFMTLEIEQSLLFIYDANNNLLQAHADGRNDSATPPDFNIPLLADRSAIAAALLANESRYLDIADSAALTVVDRQLLNHCRNRRLLCLPLRAGAEPVGALLLGIDGGDPQQQRPTLLATLCNEIAGSVRARLQLPDGAASESALQQRIREVLHEAGNPLSIIGNYLETLRLKLGEDQQLQGDLDLIKSEIDRIGSLLLRLRDPQSDDGSGGRTDVNALIGNVARIFQQSLCAAHGIELQVALGRGLTDLSCPGAKLQQVLTNLLKNAVEALPSGGRIAVTSDGPVLAGGRRFAEIVVEDNGPGIPETILAQLFSPVQSTKGSGHSGLGLSISRKLIEEMGGTISCRSNSGGTRFQLLLPLA